MTRRPLRALVGAAAVLVLAACDDANPPSTLPATRDPGQPVSLSPASYLLRPDQLAGYRRSASETLSAETLAAAENDAGLAVRLHAEGFDYGARWTYGPPNPQVPTTPFQVIVSQAVLFHDAAGATRYFAEERGRRDQPPSSGGTVAPLADLPSAGTEQSAGFVDLAGAGNISVTPRTFLGIARRGRVVIELLGSGTIAGATRARFDDLLRAQESLLATSPDI